MRTPKEHADWIRNNKIGQGRTPRALHVGDDKANVIPFTAPEPPGPSLVSTCASEIGMEQVVWIWEGRIAKGKHTCIAGEPGVGKSQLSTSITATVTMGGLWPCGEGRSPQGSVLILSAEDGAADTIVPRLHAAAADLGRVHIISSVIEDDERRGFSLQRDLALLEAECERIGDVALIIIDPVSSYLGKTDSHKNAEVRSVLEPLGEFAERMGVAVLSITHFSKTGSGSTAKALHRFIGSIAFVGAPRVALAVIEEDGRRLLLHAKNNLAAPPRGLAYKIQEKLVGQQAIVTSHLVWEGEHVDRNVDDAMQQDRGRKAPDRDDAEEFLRGLLAGGPMKQVDVEDAARGHLHAWGTVRRAATKLGIKPRKVGMDGGWLWGLPTSQEVSAFGEK
jgi:putative DNA primase/helicase